MSRIVFTLVILLILPSVSFAYKTEIYAVKIGSYEKYSSDVKQAVKKYDHVHVFTFKNLSRITIGEFTSKESAKPLLKKLVTAGFKDAFICKQVMLI